MKEIMLDLETLGTAHDALIVQVGACIFDRYTGYIFHDLEINIDKQSALDHGFQVDAETLNWWLNQPADTRKKVFAPQDTMNIVQAMEKMNDFLANADTIWSHATFDWVKIMNHLNILKIKPKFGYRSARDLRTLVDISGVDIYKDNFTGTSHTTLDDCRFQVKYVYNAFQLLNSKA